jgi:hypothetical protein
MYIYIGYCHLKEEALYRTMWRNRFGGDFGPVVRQNTEWININSHLTENTVSFLKTNRWTLYGELIVVDCRGSKECINELCGRNLDVLFYKKINFVPKKLLHVSTRLGHHQVYIDSLHLHKFLNPDDNPFLSKCVHHETDCVLVRQMDVFRDRF